MADQDKKQAGAENKRKKFYGRQAKGMAAGRTTYKSKVAGLEDDIFNVGAASDPAKFSKLLKNIQNYIQKTYRSPDNMVKTLQNMKKVTLSYPTKPKKQDLQCCDEDGNPDEDMFDMALFTWKEDYKSMKSRMDKYRDNESNAWALIYDQCLPKLKNKLKATDGYSGAKSTNDVAKLLTIAIHRALPLSQYDIVYT
jgi:hypothetical protein